MKVIIFAALIAVALAAEEAYPKANPNPSYPTPAYPTPAYPTPAYPTPAYKSYDYPAQPYSFSYEVNDAPSYNNYGHSESSDGKVTTGSYRVALADGRTQIVTYKADSYGYNAEVKYEGYARYPEYKPAYSTPAYKTPEAYPTPAYKSPTYPNPAY